MHEWLQKDWLMTSVALHPQAVTSGAAFDLRKRTMRVERVGPAAVSLGKPQNVRTAGWNSLLGACHEDVMHQSN